MSSNQTHADSSDLTIQRLCAQARGAAFRLKRRLPAHVEVDDLISAGNLGISRALVNWRSGEPAAFEAYAMRCAVGAMLEELRSADPLTRKQRRIAAALNRAEATLCQALGRPPEPDELAQELGVSDDALSRMRVRSTRFGKVSLSQTESIYPVQCPRLHPEAELVESERVEKLFAAIDELPERLQTILKLSCGEDLTLREIGSRLGVTEARICQLRKSALAQLRETCRDTVLPPPMETARAA
ncbi:MAG: sigma-70 family RNA polymerase sigma factor [Myxococcales bacterium]|nr:sigma-70 family RNA polymerase sigma factor [Myxococcales bacterium]